MTKPSIRTITVRNLITFLLAAALILLVIFGINFRFIGHKIIKNKAIAISEVIKAGLTAHMKAGIMDKRDYFLEEIRSLYEVNQVSIIRSVHVTNQFGLGRKIEKEADSITGSVFDSRKPIFILDEFSLTPTVKAVIPYIASSDGALNCLSCHHVDEGTVLGAVEIELNLKEYQEIGTIVLLVISSLSIIFIVLIIINTLRMIRIHVKEPLESLVGKAREAYEEHHPVNPDTYKSREFENVAKEINLFQAEINASQDLLRQKNIELSDLNHEIEDTLKETVFTMGTIEEQRSKETKNHTKMVTQYSRLLASMSGLSEREIDLITAAAPLHDIGKLGISDDILLKPGRLTREEQKLMKNHPFIGHAMLIHSERDILKAAAIIAFQHHEKWDGTGYPMGLKGYEIHVFGRIVTLADVFDALISSRSYKESWDLEEIIQTLNKERGKHFDPHLLDIFLDHIDEFVKIKEQYQ